MRGFWYVEHVIKSYGAFIQNTLKPIAEDIKEVLELSEEAGIKLETFMATFIKTHIVTTMINILRDIIVTLVICLTLYAILH